MHRAAANGPQRSKRITRAVGLDDVRDLLTRTPNVTVAFAVGDDIEAAPASFRLRGGRYWVGLDRAYGARPRADRPLMLLIDEGAYYFELRGVRIRGSIARPDDAPRDLPDGLDWFELLPQATNAWDYGTLRPGSAS